MTDYRNIWVKWIAFLNMDLKFRKEVFESLNIEVTKGFDIILQISTEEIEANFSDKKLFSEIKTEVESILSLSVWGGYSLYLISEGVDPEKENLVASQKTSELGNVWMKNYLKDNNKSLLLRMDQFLSILIEKQTQSLMNGFFLEYPKVQKLPYIEIAKIETFSNWCSHQGFLFGMIEHDLNYINKDR